MNKKQEMIERLKMFFEEGTIVIPKRFPTEELISWEPESDASLALRYALHTSCQNTEGLK